MANINDYLPALSSIGDLLDRINRYEDELDDSRLLEITSMYPELINVMLDMKNEYQKNTAKFIINIENINLLKSFLDMYCNLIKQEYTLFEKENSEYNSIIKVISNIEKIFNISRCFNLVLSDMDNDTFKKYSNIKNAVEERDIKLLKGYTNWLCKEMIKYKEQISSCSLLSSDMDKLKRTNKKDRDAFAKELKDRLEKQRKE